MKNKGRRHKATNANCKGFFTGITRAITSMGRGTLERGVSKKYTKKKWSITMNIIDLDAIITSKRNLPGGFDGEKMYSYAEVRAMIKETAHQALVLASENAKTKLIQQHYEAGGAIEVVDKKSILDVEKLIK
jgi:hypothetical protein